MIETNVRILQPGVNLYLETRCAKLEVQDPSPDLLQRTCSALRQRGLAAVPCPEGPELLVAASKPIPPIVLQRYDWRVEVNDSGRKKRLHFGEPQDLSILTQLIERCLLVEVGRRTDLWKLDSPRIWYESVPFKISENFAAYRRFEASALPIECVGLGLVVDASTAFFTLPTVADFFKTDIPTRAAENPETI